MPEVIDWIASRDWAEAIKLLASLATAGASVAMAVVAVLALRNWQQQDKAKREAEFLDAIIEAAHAYIIDMGVPIQVMGDIKLAMDCHVPTREPGDETAKQVKGTIAYIMKDGEHDSKSLREELRAAQLAIIRLSSLATKGQIFSFDGYPKCQNAVQALIRQFELTQWYSVIIGRTSSNWQNPAIIESVTAAFAVNPNEIKEILQKNNVAIIEFARDTHTHLYGSKQSHQRRCSKKRL